MKTPNNKDGMAGILLDVGSFVSEIFAHSFRILTLRHNGDGLPKTRSIPFYILLAAALLIGVFAQSDPYDATAIVSHLLISGFLFMVLAIFIKPQFAAAVFCLTIGLDVVYIAVGKPPLLGVFDLVWSFAAASVFARRLSSRLRQEIANGK